MMVPLLLASIKVLLLTGASDEPHHHWRETTASIRELLHESGRFEVFVNEEPRALSAAALEGFAVVVVNYNGPRWPAAAEQALAQFVRDGHGLVAFHLSSYGPFSEWNDWERMIGAHWDKDKIGHQRRWAFDVEWTEKAGALGSGAKFVAVDELYHRLTLLPGTDVIASAASRKDLGGTGNREPQIWTNRFGGGRVFFTTLGHDTAAFHQEGMRGAFARGVEWAGTGSVAPAAPRPQTPKVRLLVVTSGHGYPNEFYAVLRRLRGVEWRHAATHEEAFARPLEERYDAVLLHDMHDTTTPKTRERLRAFVEAGKGVVSLHHAIVNYTDWPWWYEEVVGGKYFVKPVEGHAASRYHEDVDFLVTPVKGREKHPVLAGVPALWVNDELYRGMWHSPRIEVLMETTHPENDRPVVYVGPHQTARSVFIQLGHSAQTMRDPAFQRLLENAVHWTGSPQGKKP
jgi:type 1 glutamine amidotransferase